MLLFCMWNVSKYKISSVLGTGRREEKYIVFPYPI